MTTPDVSKFLAANAMRRFSLLRTLAYLNRNNRYPTATQLVKLDDRRDKVPYATMSSRRSLINEMRDSGLILGKQVTGSPYFHLEITKLGTEVMLQLKAKIA